MRRYFRCFSSLLVLLIYFGIHASNTSETQAAQDLTGRDAESFSLSDETSDTFVSDSLMEESDYYLVRGREVRLRRSARQMVVKFNDEASDSLFAFADQPAEQNAALQSILQVAVSEMDVSIERQLSQGIFIVNASPTDGTPLQRSQIEEFGAMSDVAYAYPLFYSQQDSHALVLTDEILVRFSPEFNEQNIQDFCQRNGLLHLRRSTSGPDVRVLRLIDPKARSPLEAANAITNANGVLWAEPNFLSEVKFQTVDPLFDDQWHLHNTGQGGGTPDADVDGPEAWAELGSGGSPDIVIAIVDTGVDLDHEDLDIWQNPGETGDGRETNGIDDDGNGYVDDYQGWDFYSGDNDPGPGGSHGTACAGVAAAIGDNGIGIAGIAHGSRILPIKITATDINFATNEQLGLAIAYAADLADVISCSWGGGSESNYIMDAIDYAVTEGRGGLGCPVFFSAGNSAARGWRYVPPIPGAPAGTNIFRFEFTEGYGGSGTGRLWVDEVTMQDGTTENFDAVAPPTLPAGWTTSGDADWTTVASPDPVYGGAGNSAQSGSIGPGEHTYLSFEKTYTLEGSYSFFYWCEPGDADQFAIRLYSSAWGGWSDRIRLPISNSISFPASYANSIAVGASNNLDLQSVYSQYGEGLDFVAPSNGGTLGITTTDRTGAEGYSSTNYTDDFGGTSSATPLAAGIAALILTDNPNLSEEDVKTVMRSSCERIGSDPYDETEWNQYYGYGRVNAYNALELSHASLLRFGERAFTVAENGMNATITVVRDGNLSGEVSVEYTTADGTATAGVDYGAVSGTLVFPDGDDTPQTITIPIYNDNTAEANETVLLSLTNPMGEAVVAAPRAAVLTIVDQLDYYVNDGSTENDQWCTAPGDDLNDGLTPATPKATVQSILETYDLDPGDTVHIDTGDYTLTSNIQVTEDDEGSSAAPVIFEASPYGVTIDRGDSSYDSYVWDLYYTEYVAIRTAESTGSNGTALRPMKITGGYYGIQIYSGHHFLIQGIEITDNGLYGIYILSSNQGMVRNCLIHHNYNFGLNGILSDYNVIENNTIIGNGDDQVNLSGSSDGWTIKNNIIWADGSSDYGIYTYSALAYSDYNLIYATNGASVGYHNGVCTTLIDWQAAAGGDLNSLSLDPDFVDPDNGDLHLKSTEGSYHSGAWSPDATSSLAIDGGDPTDDANDEPEENGDRINLGGYGGTDQASKTPHGRIIILTSLYAEEVIDGTYEISWRLFGSTWQATDTLALAYSRDDGATWHTIADFLSAYDGMYAWNSTTVPDGPNYLIRITCNQDAGAFVESDGWVTVHNGPIEYYVNDGSTADDWWCTAPGNDLNDGLTPATPRATVQSILTAYNLEPGDIVHIDTGSYTLTSTIQIAESDEGSSVSPVTFEASPYGATIDRSNSSYGSYVWDLYYSEYVAIRTAVSTMSNGIALRPMKITGGYYGIRIYYGHNFLLQNMEIANNAYDGIYIYRSDMGMIRNCLIHHNTDDGIYVGYSDYNVIENNTVVGNGDDQVYLTSSLDNLTMKNNMIWADGSSDYGIYSSTTPAYSDYNLIYATNGAYVGYRNGACTTLSDWQAATGGDTNSLSLDPLFVNMGSGDYHLTSETASYHEGLWLPDGTYSPGIDAGDPTDYVGVEPAPNSNRINLGAYGGTRQASLSLDSDLDGLGDVEEDINGNGIWDAGETNPFDDDTDDDGLKDGEEKAYWGFDWNSDFDGDGLINILDPDSDGDGWSDGVEVRRGTDPGDPNDKPGTSLPWIQPLLLDN